MDETTAALDAGKADFAALLAASLPHATLHDEAGLAWIDSELPDAAFNYVYRAPATHTGFAHAAAYATDHFRHRRRPFHWNLGLRPEPPRAAETLTSSGLRLDETEPCMWLDLADPPDRSAPPPAPTPATAPGLRIDPVTDNELLRRWMHTWGCGAPSEVVENWYRAYSALPYGPDGTLRMFLGTLAGEPVATVYLHLVGDTAIVHYVVTPPPLRRRGIGTAMTGFATRQAREAGCRTAVLTASPLGAGIYRRLGFRETGPVDTYLWTPGRDGERTPA
jgi:GNAT superfamily N-acetyltransferase